MTEAKPAILQSRVGKRVLLLFVVSALAPLGVMAALSLSQVREVLIAQGKTRLTAIAKDYALGVYDRLQTARDAALLVGGPAGPSTVPRSLAAQFSFLGRYEAGGKFHPLIGSPSPEAENLLAEYRSKASPPPTWVRSTENESVFLLESIAATGTSAGENAVLIGKLNPAFLWSDAEEIRGGMIVCVIDSAAMRYLRCENGRELDLPRLVANAGPNREPADVIWSRNGMTYRGRVWAQFMTNDFAAKDWYYAVSIPEDDMLAAVNAFRYSFVLVVGLALLLIVWFSTRQIRAMLTPLGHLTEGTRRIAQNDYKARVSVGSKDEFGELGEAFNSMSARLGRQFGVSQAHADIDRRILGREDIGHIVEATLGFFRVLLPTMPVMVLLLDRTDASRGRRYALRAGAGDTACALHVEPMQVPQAAHPDLTTKDLVCRDDHGDVPEWARWPDADKPGTCWVQPLVWGRAACGWLWLNAPDGQSIGDEDRRTISDLSSRLALAVASAWRDEELYQQAHYDALTGLPNRLLFNDRLQREISRGARGARMAAVLFVDLDHFKAVNDSQGHGAGDALLCDAARRITSTIRDSDTVSRHGGDEFTVLLADIHEHRDALRAADGIIRALSEPFAIGGQDCFLSASVGISIFPDNGKSAEELLKNADTAMYRAKGAGRGQAMFFEERMNAEAVARLAIDRELRQALERGELTLFYQPQVSLQDTRVVACEALIRWNHPQRGLLGPGAFIAVAEESGLINAIGRWVIDEACRQVVAWRRDGLTLERVSVNVSARQFRDADFVDHIQERVVATGLASSIEFEITETALLERMDLLEQKLKAIADAGSKIALDDFGTGFSSMAYLKKLTVHVVKIDRAFVEDIDKSAEALAFVDAIIAMAHALGKSVIAEGAETDAQVSLLRERGCDLVQGYCYSKPLQADAFAAFVKAFGRTQSI